MTEEVGWIWEGNLKPFIDYVSNNFMYEMAIGELKAHVELTQESDAEKNLWHKIDFQNCTLYLAPDQGTQVIRVKVDAAKQHKEQLQVIVSFLACYSVCARA